MRLSQERPTSTQCVWDSGLKARLEKAFLDKSMLEPKSDVRRITVAQFISTMYELDVLKRERWPVPRIIEEMHLRRYADDVLLKSSFGAQPPPGLNVEECRKWIAHFRVIALNQL